MKIKQIMISAAIFLWAFAAAALFREFVWDRFIPPQTTGSSVEYYADDPEMVSRIWFQEYFDQLKGWTVPYEYRITDARINQAEVLDDLDEPYVQLDYTVYTASSNTQIVQNLELMTTDTRRMFTGQMVLHFTGNGDGTYTLDEKMRPVQYQIMTPEFQEERNTPQTQHYKIRTDEPMTYYIADGVLYVTYDSGDTLIEVPDGYEKVCAKSDGRYEELLHSNSYIVTEEFTGFVAGNDLLYSTDMGLTWQTSHIGDYPNLANSFFSRTDNGYYVTFAGDRSLGRNYYTTFYSSDLENWKTINSKEGGWSGLTCVYWTQSGIGYYAQGEYFYMTPDGGATWQEIEIPEAVEVTAELGFNPYDTVERMYEESGILYLVVGQGDDGDYVRDGSLVEALYESQDGSTFTFVEEIADDTPEEAG